MYNNLDKYDIADMEGRFKICKALYTVDKNTRILSYGLKERDDLAFKSGDTKYILECKDYHSNSEHYPRVLINAHKIDRLEELNKPYLLALSWDDDIVKFFDVKYLKENNMLERKPIYTYISEVDHSKGKEWQDKYFFPKDEYLYKIDIKNYKVL